MAYRKGLDTTRVLVLVAEKVEGGAAVKDAPMTGPVAAALKAAGFGEVQGGQALLQKYGAGRIAKMTDGQVREAARRIADVVVFGVAAASGAMARSNVRAIDVGTGAVLWRAPPGEVQGKGTGEQALEALGDALGASLSAALGKAESQP